jgi:hypothetical protein
MPRERIRIPIPQSQFPTQVQVYLDGDLKQVGGAQSGDTEITIRLPAPINECEIKIYTCDQQGKPVGRGFIYQDKQLQPEPVDMPAPVEKVKAALEVIKEVIAEAPDVIEVVEPEADKVEKVGEVGEALKVIEEVIKEHPEVIDEIVEPKVEEVVEAEVSADVMVTRYDDKDDVDEFYGNEDEDDS